MRTYLRPPAGRIGLSLLLWAILPRLLIAQEPTPINTDLPAAEEESVASLAQRFESVTSEEAGRDLIEQVVAAVRPGAEGFFSHKKISELRQSEIADLGRNRNLAVAIRQRERDVADAALTGSAAAFDPFFSVALNHSRFDSYHRTSDVYRLRDKFSQVDFTQLQLDFFQLSHGVPNTSSNFVCAVVDGELANPECQSNVLANKQLEFASFHMHDQFLWGSQFILVKNFSWGGNPDPLTSGNIRVELDVTREKKDFFSFPGFLEGPVPSDPALGVVAPINVGSRLPWTSFLDLSFETPLPYTKNFGEYGNTSSIGIKNSAIGLQEADWNMAATFNQVLGNPFGLRDQNGNLIGLMQRYWQLIGALKQVQVLAAQDQILEQIVASTRRQFDQQLVTAYDMAQAEAQLQNLRDSEQIAWNNYVLASNAVADLLDYPPDTIIVPSGYAQAFAMEYTVDAAGVRRTALDNRRELKSAQGEVDKAQNNLNFAENQVRPDLSLSASAVLAQNNTAFGYQHVTGSLLNLFEPDSSDFFVGISYRLPFGLQAEKSRLGQARNAMTIAMDNHAQTELGVTQQVDNALAGFLSARAQKQLAQQRMELAELAYAKVERLKNLGLASQFELLQTLNDMLSARSNYIDATVGYHQAYVQLQASEGLYE
ncbi:MAG TPA: TolC family protein [Gammaproteobacteria bacterium]|nr:TolC family protein [Gammaproteobacteria bacterium]